MADSTALARATLRVLLVEDNPGDADLVEYSLTQAEAEAGVRVLLERVERLSQAMSRLGDGGVLMDRRTFRHRGERGASR